MVKDYRKAQTTLYDAEQLANKVNNDRQFFRVYTALASLNISRENELLDDTDNFIITLEAIRWLELAREHAQNTGDIGVIASAITYEGQWAVKRGALKQGFEAFRYGLRLGYQYNLNLQIAWAFGEFREYSRRLGQFADAVRFRTFEREYRYSLNFLQDFDIKHRLDECYQALGEEGYQREVDIAASWSLEQAVEYALALPPPPPD